MSELDIIDFLRTGEFKEFPFGTHINQFIDAFGQTTWTIPVSKKDKRPAILKYNLTEFCFSSNKYQKLEGIQVTYSQPGDRLKFNCNYHNLQEALTYSEIKIFLSMINISFIETLSRYDDETKAIVTGSQVIFLFHDDERLNKFGRFVR